MLRSYIEVLVLLTKYRCLIGENRQDSTESLKNANLACQVVVMQFPPSSLILKKKYSILTSALQTGATDGDNRRSV